LLGSSKSQATPLKTKTSTQPNVGSQTSSARSSGGYSRSGIPGPNPSIGFYTSNPGVVGSKGQVGNMSQASFGSPLQQMFYKASTETVEEILARLGSDASLTDGFAEILLQLLRLGIVYVREDEDVGQVLVYDPEFAVARKIEILLDSAMEAYIDGDSITAEELNDLLKKL